MDRLAIQRMSPWSGTTAPDSALISVDFPAPLSPITAQISPGIRSKSAPFMATTRAIALHQAARLENGLTVVIATPSATIDPVQRR
jgi:hypothetical protein